MNRDRRNDTLPSPKKPKGHTIIPDGQLRLVPSADALAQIRVGKGFWLGLYEGPGGPGHTQVNTDMRRPALICRGTSPIALSLRLAKLSVTWPLFVRCEKSKRLLPTHLEQDKISDAEKNWRKLKRSAFEAIGSARRRLDPGHFGLSSVPLKAYDWFLHERLDDGLINKPQAASLYQQFAELAAVLFTIEEEVKKRSEKLKPDYSTLATRFSDALRRMKAGGAFQIDSKNVQRDVDAMLALSDERVTAKFMEMEDADRFLRKIVKQARKAGKKPGDKATAEENERMLSALRRLLPVGKTRLGATKVVVSEDAADILTKAKNLRTQLRRFCIRVHEARQRTITGEDLYETFGFDRGEWPLIQRVAAVGKHYASGQKRRDAK